jgi:hypothetical protein
MKNKKFLSIFIVLLIVSCNNKNKQNIPVEPDQEINTNEKNNSLEKERTQPDLSFLIELIGKYPTQENIFKNKILTKRLSEINDFNFDKMVQNWNKETPISMNDQIIHSSGCKDSDCASNGYELFIDLKNDNINVFYFRGNTLRVYTEKDWIALPKIFEDELEIKKSNAKIGSIDDTESTYDITPLTYSPHNSNKETANKISVFLKDILKSDLDIMSEEQRKFQYEEVDLNGDGIKEYLVGFKNSYFCGSGGCTFYLLHNNGSVITIFTVSDAPFIVMVESKTNGWKDLLVKSDGALRLLKFNGKTYPNNPSVATVFNNIPSDDAYRLLWDEFPIPYFNF